MTHFTYYKFHFFQPFTFPLCKSSAYPYNYAQLHVCILSIMVCLLGLVSRTSSRDHITPVLRQLHWLPVRFRIMYKILLITYKCLHGLAPDYLTELIQEYKPSRNLRSSSKMNLVTTSVSTASYGQRSFYYAAPELWNTLPLHIKNSKTVEQFKSSLKTYLFTIAFCDN